MPRLNFDEIAKKGEFDPTPTAEELVMLEWIASESEEPELDVEEEAIKNGTFEGLDDIVRLENVMADSDLYIEKDELPIRIYHKFSDIPEVIELTVDNVSDIVVYYRRGEFVLLKQGESYICYSLSYQIGERNYVGQSMSSDELKDFLACLDSDPFEEVEEVGNITYLADVPIDHDTEWQPVYPVLLKISKDKLLIINNMDDLVQHYYEIDDVFTLDGKDYIRVNLDAVRHDLDEDELYYFVSSEDKATYTQISEDDYGNAERSDGSRYYTLTEMEVRAIELEELKAD